MYVSVSLCVRVCTCACVCMYSAVPEVAALDWYSPEADPVYCMVKGEGGCIPTNPVKHVSLKVPSVFLEFLLFSLIS